MKLTSLTIYFLQCVLIICGGMYIVNNFVIPHIAVNPDTIQFIGIVITLFLLPRFPKSESVHKTLS